MHVHRSNSFCCLLIVLSAMLVLTLCACGGGGDSKQATPSPGAGGSLAVKVNWDDRPHAVQSSFYRANDASIDCNGLSTVDIQVYGPPPTSSLLASGGPWECQLGQGRVDNIPATNGCTVVLIVRNSEGQIAYHGTQGGVHITAGQTARIEIAARSFQSPSLSPADGTESNAVALGWTQVPGAEAYEIRVSTDSALDGYNTYLASAPPYSVPGLTASTNYYWQVLAVDAYNNRGVGSQISSFRLSLGVPVPSFPDDGFIVTESDVTCQWSEVAGSTYHIYIATDQEMTNGIVDTPVDTNAYTFSDLTPDTTYYWQVCAVDDNGPGNRSEIRSFSTFVGPQLETPVDDQVLPKENIQLGWSAYSGGESLSYEVIISHSQDMSDMGSRVIKADTAETYYTPAAGLLNDDQTYYWRVIAHIPGDPIGYPSPVAGFNTLGKPAAQLPNAGSTFFQKPFNFSWTASNNGSGYRIVVSENSDFGGAAINSIRATNAFGIQPGNSSLSYGSTYFWRVYALDSNNQQYDAYASDVRSFQVFGVPSIVYPPNRDHVPNGGFNLQWSSVENATRYHVYFRKEGTDSVAPIVVDGSTSAAISRFSLSDGQSYYWRVSALDANGNEGAMSDEVYFNTEEAVRISDVNTYPPASVETPDTFRYYDADELVEYNNYLFFTGYDGETYGLYRSDGTPGNVQRVGDYTNPQELTLSYGGLYFIAKEPFDSRDHLYRIEDPATLTISPVLPPGDEEYPYYHGNKSRLLAENRLFFTVTYYVGEGSTENRITMWYTTDGTVSNTHQMAFSGSIPNPYALPLRYITAPTGGRFFFMTDKHHWLSNERADLWCSYYPLHTATRLTNDSSGPWEVGSVGDLNGILIFFGSDSAQPGSGSRHLWKSDGTVAGTSILVRDISGKGVSAKKDGIIYFWAKDPDGGHDYLHLWRTDGTVTGTSPLEDSSTGSRIRSGDNQQYPGPYIATLGQYLYFRHDRGGLVGDELHRSTGTYDSLEMVYNLPSGADGSMGQTSGPDFVLALKGKIYYRGNLTNVYTADDADRLCVTDGTAQGTYWVDPCDIYPCSSFSHYVGARVGLPVADDDKVIYFPASGDDGAGRELWRHKPNYPN